MSDCDYAWAAGFFDGEGWASAARYNRKRGGMTAALVIGVGQAERELLDRFQRIVAVGTVNGPYARANMYFWKAHGLEKVELVSRLLWPWLGSKKRSQIQAVIDDGRAHRRRQPKRLFSDEEVVAIRRRLASGEGQSAIARDLGCQKTRIHAIARGHSYRQVAA